MPAHSISFDDAYNKRLREMLYSLEHTEIFKHQPEYFGGGSHYPQRYALQGNSGSYPPVQMLAELKSSGGGMGDDVKEYAKRLRQHVTEFVDEIKPIAQRRGRKVAKEVRHEVNEGLKKLDDLAKGAEQKYLGEGPLTGRKPRTTGGKVNRVKKAKKWLDFAAQAVHQGVESGKEINQAVQDAKNPMTAAVRKAVLGSGRKPKGAGFGDFMKNVIDYGLDKGQNVTLGDAVKGYKSMGGAKKRAPSAAVLARAKIVKEVMKKHGLKLIPASKYVKEHNLY
jgi:hypothetical protein